jgi:two-component system, NarL family, nitrate/nitrite response regulator NarL
MCRANPEGGHETAFVKIGFKIQSSYVLMRTPLGLDQGVYLLIKIAFFRFIEPTCCRCAGHFQGWGMLDQELGEAANSNRQETASSGNSSQSFETMLLCGNALLRAGLTHLLSGTCFAVIEAKAGFVDYASAPGLYIVDGTSSQQMLDFVQQAKRLHPTARIVALANSFDLEAIQLAVSAGVDSFCLATAAREVLINILELTMLGERILPGSVVQSLLRQAPALSSASQLSSEQNAQDPRVGKLSRRETVILQSLMGGDANKVIARKLEITEATIKVHVKSILRKIGAANRTQAAMWANENLRNGEQPLRKN